MKKGGRRAQPHSENPKKDLQERDRNKEHGKGGTNLLKGETLWGKLGLELFLSISSPWMDKEATLGVIPRNPL